MERTIGAKREVTYDFEDDDWLEFGFLPGFADGWSKDKAFADETNSNDLGTSVLEKGR